MDKLLTAFAGRPKKTKVAAQGCRDGLGVSREQSRVAAVVDRQIAALAPHIGVAQGLFTTGEFTLVPAAFADAVHARIAVGLDVDGHRAEIAQAQLVQQSSIKHHEVAGLAGQGARTRRQLGMDDAIEHRS